MAGVFKLARRSISSSVARFAAAEAGAASNELRLNLCTPHKPMHLNKTIAGMVLPGEGHYFGVTAQVRQYAAQLKPGVVTIYHVGVRIIRSVHRTIINIFHQGEEEKYFVPGGFAFQGPDSIAVRNYHMFLTCV